MRNAILIGGRLVGPRNVELNEPVADLNATVEVIVRPAHGEKAPALSNFLGNLPPGTRSREEIDQQIQSERTAWENRG